MDRVRIRARDTADTGITAEPPDSSQHVQSFSLSPGTEVGSSLVDEGVVTEVGSSWPITEKGISSGEGPEIEVS